MINRQRARRRPVKPFHSRVSFKIALRRANGARLPDGRRLPGCGVRMVAALAIRQSQVRSGVVYAGNVALAELAGMSARRVTDVKYLLEEAGLVYLTNTGPEGKVLGGKTRDEHGRVVASATGYELHPSLQKPPAARVRPEDRPRAQQARELVSALARSWNKAGP